MTYVFFVYADQDRWTALPQAERDAIECACLISDVALRESGRLLAAATLHGDKSHAAVTVRVHGQEGAASLALADGAPAQAGPQLTGLFFAHVRDLNEAIQLASRMPQARVGPIEVWPVISLFSSFSWRGGWEI